MGISLARLGRTFLALTTGMVVLTVLHLWEVVALSPETFARVVITYLLVSALLGVTAGVARLRDEGPKNRDGDGLVD